MQQYSNMQTDLFCKIIAGEIPAHVVYETPDTLAFLDVTPSAPGHTMVILKKHGNNIQEYTQEELGRAMETVKIVSQKIENALTPDSITIGINHKEKKGVPHLHIHLIPRWEKDKGHALQGVVENKTKHEVPTMAKKIKAS
jgi:histidine triad (HIT) family protein